MCRLFGFRSRAPRPVRRFLLDGPRSLAELSRVHSDGWGIGAYADGEPLLLDRSTAPAHADPRFSAHAERIESTCVLAHVRRRSVGGTTLEDTHPFHRGRLLFAHNGTIRNFEAVRGALENSIAPRFRNALRGSTDSERCFGLFLTALHERDALEEPTPTALAFALAVTVRRVRAIAGPAHALNFLVTDGRTLAGVHAGERPLCYCVWGGGEGVARQMAIASEPLTEGEEWTTIEDGEMVVVDFALGVRCASVEEFADVRVA